MRGHYAGIAPPSGPPEATTSAGACVLVGYGFPAELELPQQGDGGKGKEGRGGRGGEARHARKAVVTPATGATTTCATPDLPLKYNTDSVETLFTARPRLTWWGLELQRRRRRPRRADA
jgi:hypothetical protein